MARRVIEPVLSSTVTSENCNVPLAGRAARSPSAAQRCWRYHLLQARLFQAHKIITGLGDININRIEQLDRCQRCGLPVRHQRPFGHAGFPDTTINRRGHFGVCKVDTCAQHPLLRQPRWHLPAEPSPRPGHTPAY